MAKKSKTIKTFIFLILCGIMIGVLNGLFGGGGGMLCVPTIKKILDMEDKKAHATTVFIMALISIPSAIIYITNFKVEFLKTLFVCAGVLLGGLLGAKLLPKIKNDVLNFIFVLIMLAAGIKMLF